MGWTLGVKTAMLGALLCIPIAPVAQLDRVSASEAEGRPFESGRARQNFMT